MNIQILTRFFMWCTIINGALLIFSGMMLMFTKDFVYSIHSKFFPISRESFDVVIYSFMGFFKIIFIIFILVPYVALLIIG